MKSTLTAFFFLLSIYTQAQSNTPRLEAYISPGLFFEELSNNELIPPDRRNGSRLGDNISYGLQVAVPMKNNHFTLRAGAGFNVRHYSLNKYSLIDLNFSLSPEIDTFHLSHIYFKNNYSQIPLSFSYTIASNRKKFKLGFGLSLCFEFLLDKNVHVTFDSAYFIPQQTDIVAAKQLYAANTTKFVFTAASFVEGSFAFNKNTGLFFMFTPFSFYSSPLNKALTTSTMEIISFTGGLFYKFK